MPPPQTLPEAPADPAFLQIQDLVKTFDGVTAVDHASVDIARGEIFALLGPSGCGKSTLLRMLAGFETPTSGRIVLAGRDLSALPPHQRPMNMMFQSYALFPHLSVWDNIAFGLKREGMPKDLIATRVEAMLALVQLERYGRRKPHQLSGGQQQRVALARSLAKQPQLLLLDEPLGALDKKLREQTQFELVAIVEQVGVTCVMVTHDQDEAMTMATRIAVMRDGRFLQIGAPGDVYEAPVNRFVADFIGDVNLIDGRVERVEGGVAYVDGVDGRHEVEVGPAAAGGASAAVVTPGSEVTLALRPEKIELVPERLSGSPADATAAGTGDADGAGNGEAGAARPANAVRGTVRELAYLGRHTVVHLALPSGAILQASVANAGRHRVAALHRGDAVWARWARSSPVLLTR